MLKKSQIAYNNNPESKAKKLEYDKRYQKSNTQKKRRAARNKARAIMKLKKRVKIGDGKDVHHKDNNPENNSLNNISVISKHKNRAIK